MRYVCKNCAFEVEGFSDVTAKILAHEEECGK